MKNRLLTLPALEGDCPEARPCTGIERVKPDGAGEERLRPLPAAPGTGEEAEVPVTTRIREPGGIAKMGLRRIQLSLPERDDSEADVGSGAPGIKGEGPSCRDGGIGQVPPAARPGMDYAAIGEDKGVPGHQIQELLHDCPCFPGASRGKEAGRKSVETTGIAIPGKLEEDGLCLPLVVKQKGEPAQAGLQPGNPPFGYCTLLEEQLPLFSPPKPLQGKGS